MKDAFIVIVMDIIRLEQEGLLGVLDLTEDSTISEPTANKPSTTFSLATKAFYTPSLAIGKNIFLGILLCLGLLLWTMVIILKNNHKLHKSNK